MDRSTIIGIISGFMIIIIAIMLEGSILPFWSLSSLLIVLGGASSATLVNFSLDQVLEAKKVLKIAFQDVSKEPLEIIENMVDMAGKARREGLLALENEIEDTEDEFLKKGVQLIVDGTDPDLVRNIMETDIIMTEERHKIGIGIFSSMGATAPAFGMLGTLIGLILMLRDLNNPDALGPGMALALITTFYGSFLANLIFNPIAGKLKLKSEDESMIKEIIIEGVLSIQAGENPRIVSEKMKSFLHPGQKELLEERRKRGYANE
ncbi:MAG: motility protein A [Peptococcia bacterium]|jgi:chemotaxis protein MotA